MLVKSSKNIREVHAVSENQAVQLLWNMLGGTSDEGSMANLMHALGRIPLAITTGAHPV